jgi:hypothetical protein
MEGEIDNLDYGKIADRVIGRFEPAKRLWPVNRRLALWLAVEVLVLAIGIIATRRTNLLASLGSAHYLFEVGIFIGVGTLAAALALRGAVPGREASGAELALVVMPLLVGIVAVALQPASAIVSASAFVRAGVGCATSVMVFASIPWVILFIAIRRGAPLVKGTEGALMGIAAFSFSFAATRLGCPSDDAIHLIVWHIVPVAIGSAASVLIAMAWLRRKDSALA